DFEDAKDRVLMGPERRSMVISAKEKRSTAYHEAGHVLVGRLLPDADPVHKVTIIPRGPSLGATSMLPDEDRHNLWRPYCLAEIRVLMGGRAAEEVVFDEFCSGAANDLKRAMELAHAMVCQWGMSELGPISFGSNNEVFLGRDFIRERDFSEETASAVDKAIHTILENAYNDARAMVEKHKDILTALAEALVERETLEGEEVDAIIRKHGGADLLPAKQADTEKAGPRKPADVARGKPASETTPEVKDVPPGDVVPDTA
ncbi:MAG TPA: cell division protein FtsH, partial [Candidatus Hydrogenedentes bacterium]|nr:cell division protein FtsH [Candidatus Hydrogenedentota bacterium]